MDDISIYEEDKRMWRLEWNSPRVQLEKMWINQPSTLQPFHEYNGLNVWACIQPDKRYALVWFLTNDITFPKVGVCGSLPIMKNALSRGWKDKGAIHV